MAFIILISIVKVKITLQQLIDSASFIEEEYERIRKLQKMSKETFDSDFRHEMICIHGPPSGVEILKNNKAQKEEKPADLSEALQGSFKKIRNALARELHPDLNEEDTSEEFKDIQVAFEEGNLTKLLSSAEEHDVEVEVTNKDLSAVVKVIEAQKKYISEAKSSLEWAWMICSRKNTEREKVWAFIKLKDEKIRKYLEDNNISLQVIEAQTLAKRKIEWPEIQHLLQPRAPKEKKDSAAGDSPTLMLL